MLYVYCGEQYIDLTYRNIKRIYEISNLGNIRNKNTGIIRKLHPNEKGYLQCKLMLNDNSMKTFKIHRLVACSFLGDYSDTDLEVNHIDGNKSNNRVDNLEWVTKQYNVKHSFETGLNIAKKGEDNPSNKYPEWMIRFIIECIINNRSNKEIRLLLKEKFGINNISRYLLHDLRRKKIWKHIFDEMEK